VCGAVMIISAVVLVNWRPRRPCELRATGIASPSILAEGEAILQGK